MVILIAKDFIQNKCINYHKTLSSISKKDLFRIIMVTVTHFDLVLYQINVKIIFVKGILNIYVCVCQLKVFKVRRVVI